MKLPNGDRAFVDMAKLRDYALNPTHDKGKAKARVFRAALGVSTPNAPELQAWLLEAARQSDAVIGRQNAYGQPYVVDFDVTYRTRTATIRSVWIVLKSEDFPRLVTCYVL